MVEHEGFPACSSLQKLSHDRGSMQTTHQTLRQNRFSRVEVDTMLAEGVLKAND